MQFTHYLFVEKLAMGFSERFTNQCAQTFIASKKKDQNPLTYSNNFHKKGY